MTKKQLADRILEQNGGNPVVAIKDIMRIFQIGYVRATNVTCDLVSVSGAGKRNRAKYYFVDDVADSILRKGL